jgi:hypothetical protein
MRYLIGSQMGWASVPFIVLAGVAYVWVAERLMARKSKTANTAEAPSVKNAA